MTTDPRLTNVSLLTLAAFHACSSAVSTRCQTGGTPKALCPPGGGQSLAPA